MENLKKCREKPAGLPLPIQNHCVRTLWGAILRDFGWLEEVERNRCLKPTNLFKNKKKTTENQSLTEQNLYIHNFTSPKRKPQPSDIPPVHVAR